MWHGILLLPDIGTERFQRSFFGVVRNDDQDSTRDSNKEHGKKSEAEQLFRCPVSPTHLPPELEAQFRNASSGGLRLGNCREYRVSRPHHIDGLTTEWTNSNARFFLRFARGAKNLERFAAFLAGYDLFHRRTRKLR